MIIRSCASSYMNSPAVRSDDLHRLFEDGDWAGIEAELTELQALETAIDHIESEYEHRSLTFDPQPPLTYQAV